MQKDNAINITFQAIDWHHYHEKDIDNEDIYVMQIFGRTENGKSICVRVTDFEPYFYVEIPKTWNDRHIEIFIKCLKNKVSWRNDNKNYYDYDISESLISYETVRYKNLYYFNGNRKLRFLKLSFKNRFAMNFYSSILNYPIKNKLLSRKDMKFNLFESNVEPLLRFIHIQKLSSCGWINIKLSDCEEIDDYSHCDYSYSVNWKNVHKYDNGDEMAPFKVLGYDIECITPHQDFPQSSRITD